MGRKPLKCPQCGALNPIPPTGLELICEYCGFTRPVPDADRRREQMEREAERQRRAEEKAQETARREQEREQSRRASRRRSVVTWLVALPFKLLPLGALAYLAYYFGLHTLFMGPGGEPELTAQVAQLRTEGYAVQGAPAEIRFIFAPAVLRLDLKPGECHALALGATRRVKLVHFSGPRVTVQPRAPNQTGVSVVLCPVRGRVRRARVTLDGAGRLSWVLLSRSTPAPAPPPARAAVQRPSRRRSASVRHRRRRSRRAPQRTAPVPRAAPVPGAAPVPKAPPDWPPPRESTGPVEP